jgi:hypothetical protein
MAKFIDSIDALEELSLLNEQSNLAKDYWLYILKSQGRSLRGMTVVWKSEAGIIGWVEDEIEKLYEMASALEELSIDLALKCDHEKNPEAEDWVRPFFFKFP